MGQCNHLILHCMDYRIQAALNDWIAANGYLGDIDRISLGGACLKRQAVLEHIAIGCEKHGVKKVFLAQHQDCAGYGGSGAFSTLQAEKDKLVSDMTQLKNEITDRYPAVEAVMLLVEKNAGVWKVTSLEST